MPLLNNTSLLLVLSFPLACAAQSRVALDSVDRYVRAQLGQYRIPGLSVAILQGDTLLLARGYGYANVELHVPTSDSTVYESGSVAKQFTAAAVVMLAEQGRLSLDDAVTRFLPEGSPQWRGITIRHLLTHTSGISDYADTTLDPRRDYTEEELVRLAASQPLEFAPGDRWSYSSAGYALLGIIIHRVTGVLWGNFLKDHIFTPLGMRTARTISAADIVPNRAAGYQFVSDTLKNEDWVSPSLRSTADCCLLLSIDDLAQWAIGLNHEKVPSRLGLEASWTPVRLTGDATYPYGFGWHLGQQRGYRRIGHSGSSEGFQTTIQRYPDFGLTVIVLANVAQSLPEAMAFGIAGIVEPALTAPHVLGRPVSELQPPRSINRLLQDISNGKDSLEATRTFTAVIPSPRRMSFGRRVKREHSWTSLGCDVVAQRSISRLGTPIRWICYAKGTDPEPGLLITAYYGADWRVAFVDLYSF